MSQIMSQINSHSVAGVAWVIMLLSPVILPVGIKKYMDYQKIQKYPTKKITVKHIYTNTKPHVIIDQDDDCYLVDKTLWDNMLNTRTNLLNDHTYNITYDANNNHIEQINMFIDWGAFKNSLANVVQPHY